MWGSALEHREHRVRDKRSDRSRSPEDRRRDANRRQRARSRSPDHQHKRGNVPKLSNATEDPLKRGGDDWLPVNQSAAAALLRKCRDHSPGITTDALALLRLDHILIRFSCGATDRLPPDSIASLGKLAASLRMAVNETLSGGVTFECKASLRDAKRLGHARAEDLEEHRLRAVVREPSARTFTAPLLQFFLDTPAPYPARPIHPSELLAAKQAAEYWAVVPNSKLARAMLSEVHSVVAEDLGTPEEVSAGYSGGYDRLMSRGPNGRSREAMEEAHSTLCTVMFALVDGLCDAEDSTIETRRSMRAGALVAAAKWMRPESRPSYGGGGALGVSQDVDRLALEVFVAVRACAVQGFLPVSCSSNTDTNDPSCVAETIREGKEYLEAQKGREGKRTPGEGMKQHACTFLRHCEMLGEQVQALHKKATFASNAATANHMHHIEDDMMM